MQVTLLGTGDTTGTPTVGCDCDTCQAARDPEEGVLQRAREQGATITAGGGVERTRFSVHVHNERTDESLLIDFSPDFRQQFLREDVPLPDEAIITHIHFDHLDGLGNCFRLVDDLTVHAADETDPETDKSVAETVESDYYYLDQIGVTPQTPFEPFETCGFEVTLVPVDHPPLLCYGLAVEDPETGAKLSLSGDTSYGLSEQSREVLSDPDLLLADGIVPAHLCEYHPMGGTHHDDEGVPRTFGTKHMTREGALALAEDLNAEQTRIVHIAHYYPAEEAFEQPLALDGERYDL
ncbi:MBL fold metallo-hydrolase [Halovenus sp. WSH3]|uniref:MBL fold metallo-hydrolase n=1 Tax=Halovenus carboxidivorans TaxID=2692199 RepID=A0A6B0TBE9_9EURY|nr:MBL fold metallo-hydrolase [Halovenus carboxidivorans]MXR52230.1 MBL fold metallo-hydrolase [Halovenus carboxidivorans]